MHSVRGFRGRSPLTAGVLDHLSLKGLIKTPKLGGFIPKRDMGFGKPKLVRFKKGLLRFKKGLIFCLENYFIFN